jgi:hypothetical protein
MEIVVDHLESMIEHLNDEPASTTKVTDQSSRIEVRTAVGRIVWHDLRGLDGRRAPTSGLPTLRLYDGDDIRLSVRLPSPTPRSLVGAEDSTDLALLAVMLLDLCRDATSPEQEPCHEARIACGAHLMGRDPPLRPDSWLGLGLRMPSPWSPTTLIRVAPGSEDDISDEPFEGWDAFTARIPLDLELTTARQGATTTMSISCGSLPVLRPANELEAMRLISAWDARPTAAR